MWLMVADAFSEDSAWILLAGPAVGITVYWLSFLYYRNTNKTHNYEYETIIKAQTPTGSDQRIRKIRKTTRARTQGANGGSHRERVRRIP